MAQALPAELQQIHEARRQLVKVVNRHGSAANTADFQIMCWRSPLIDRLQQETRRSFERRGGES